MMVEFIKENPYVPLNRFYITNEKIKKKNST